ncbi:hypothetical protein MVES_003196 [Malassezia vespertilionis]|uniref:Uncharacterized protein n=1 Tax=Malassezia vespertilionis TaxID=2020962 RepID=A0A2N1J8N0_9BASI|nr:hypothetical protein MVES_003196 [Malassezia vespertilionis]
MIWPRANAAWFTGILGGLRARHLEPVRSNALQAHPGAVPFRVCGSVSHALVAFNARDAGCSALLYAAGINAFGELGNGTTDRARRGENVLEMHGIEHIAAGNGFTLVAARDGLYGCGTTARGQLGIQGRDTLLSMTQIPLPRPAARITDLSAGMDHVLLLQDASVFATGLNTDGQLAKPAVIPYATQFTHVALPEGVLPTRVIAGGDTSMVLTSSGNVFVWGNTEYGQALQAATVDQLRTPTEVDVGISVVDACLGGSFLLFLDAMAEQA